MRQIFEWAASGLPAVLVALVVVTALGIPIAVQRMQRQPVAEALRATLLDAAIAWSLVVVLVLTLALEDTGPNDIRLVPFEKLLTSLAAGDRGETREAIRDIFLNVALLAPIGFLIALRFPRLDWRRLALATALVATAVEATQAVARQTRTADITDVLTNVTGMLIGFGAGLILLELFERTGTPEEA